jgi:hypothetical protein
MDRTTRFVAVPGCLATTLGNEVVVLNLENGVYYGLNAVAASVWKRLSTPCSLSELVVAVEAEFEAADNDVESDLRSLLETLGTHGLVTEVDVAAPAL